MRLRWKQNAGKTRLEAIGAGPGGHTLWDGKMEYAHIDALGGDWRGPFRGWFWYSAFGGYQNTCDTPQTLEKCKVDAAKWVKSKLKGA